MTNKTDDVVAEMIAKLRQKELSGSRYVHGKQLMNRRNFDGDEAADLIQSLSDRIAVLEGLLNTPEVEDWAKGVVLEAAHQRERWGVDHDAGKSPFDWFWLIGYLSQKAAASAVAGGVEKAKHHTISTAAALANWHLALSGTDTIMRPGIGPGNGGEKVGSAYDLAARTQNTPDSEKDG